MQIYLIYCYGSLCLLMALISKRGFVCFQAVFIHGQFCSHRPIIINLVFSCNWRIDLLSRSMFLKSYQFTHELNTMLAPRFIGYLWIHWYLGLVRRRQRNSVHVMQMNALNWTVIWGYTHVNKDEWDSLNTHRS